MLPTSGIGGSGHGIKKWLDTATIPGRPFVNNLKSKYFPILGLSSIPMYKSYMIEPVTSQHSTTPLISGTPTTELSILLVSWT
jgi:hypothetical protein